MDTAHSNSSPGGAFTLGGDMPVNRMGYGAMRITGDGVWGMPKDKEESLRVLRRAVELGVNFIDTADSYGPFVSEDLIAEALHPYADGLVIATKGGLTRQGPGEWNPVGRPNYIKQCVEMSLRRLKVERIDLYQLHRIDPDTPAEDTLGALKELQEAGKIRHVGLSEVNRQEMEMAQKILPIVSTQNEYNLSTRKSEDVLHYCQENNLGFIPWFPVASGKLAREGGPLDQAAKRHEATVAQLALAWLLHHSPVMLPIPGTSKVDHLEENVKAAYVELTGDEWAAIEADAKGNG